MSRFPAEVTITTIDGERITECFNQTEMAFFVREALLAQVEKGETLVAYDEEPHEIPASRVARVEVHVQESTELQHTG
ncbi:MAG: hypothetical protein ACXVAK_10765 [Vulcanimicrobiaceae bacterium]